MPGTTFILHNTFTGADEDITLEFDGVPIQPGGHKEVTFAEKKRPITVTKNSGDWPGKIKIEYPFDSLSVHAKEHCSITAPIPVNGDVKQNITPDEGVNDFKLGVSVASTGFPDMMSRSGESGPGNVEVGDDDE